MHFANHKSEQRNHEEASLNCVKKEKPLLSRPRTKWKGSQRVGMDQHWGCHAGCPSLSLWPLLSSGEGPDLSLEVGILFIQKSVLASTRSSWDTGKTPNISLVCLG